MKYDIYEYNKAKNKYEFLDCMTLSQIRKNGVSEAKRVKVGTKNLQKYIIK